MPDKPKREKYKKTEEEFVGEGLVKNKKARNSESKRSNYEEWTLEDLHQEAGKKNIKNYKEMNREELINRLKSRE